MNRNILCLPESGLLPLFLLLLFLAAGGQPVAAAQDDDFMSAAPLSGTGTTVITSHRLEFDNQQRTAVFTGNVLVRDDTLRMRSDRLKINFNENEEPELIEADGNVAILQQNRLARSQAAVYDLIAGKMVLTGQAELRRGRDMLRGDTITFWRDQDRIEVVPGTLIITPEARGSNDRSLMP